MVERQGGWETCDVQTWLIRLAGEDISIFKVGAEWVLAYDAEPAVRRQTHHDPGEIIAGPFPTLDAAKAAYLLLAGS